MRAWITLLKDFGKIMCDLKEKCPACLSKNQAEDEIEIIINLNSPIVIDDIANYVKGKIEDD